jgi:hypothetical protein
MKIKISMFILISLFLTISIYSQNEITETEAKTSLTNLFDLSKSKSYEEASLFLAYNGKDEAKINKVAFNYADKKEKKAVKRKCKKIKAYLDLSDSYEYDGFSSNGNSGTIKVNFKSGDQELKISFTFVKISGKVLLSDFK